MASEYERRRRMYGSRGQSYTTEDHRASQKREQDVRNKRALDQLFYEFHGGDPSITNLADPKRQQFMDSKRGELEYEEYLIGELRARLAGMGLGGDSGGGGGRWGGGGGGGGGGRAAAARAEAMTELQGLYDKSGPGLDRANSERGFAAFVNDASRKKQMAGKNIDAGSLKSGALVRDLSAQGFGNMTAPIRKGAAQGNQELASYKANVGQFGGQLGKVEDQAMGTRNADWDALMGGLRRVRDARYEKAKKEING